MSASDDAPAADPSPAAVVSSEADVSADAAPSSVAPPSAATAPSSAPAHSGAPRSAAGPSSADAPMADAPMAEPEESRASARDAEEAKAPPDAPDAGTAPDAEERSVVVAEETLRPPNLPPPETNRKIVVRNIPPCITAEEFTRALSRFGFEKRISSMHYMPGKEPTAAQSFKRLVHGTAYLYFNSAEEGIEFSAAADGAMFRDCHGNSSRLGVECFFLALTHFPHMSHPILPIYHNHLF